MSDDYDGTSLDLGTVCDPAPPATLAAGGSYECVIADDTALEGLHYNEVTADASHNGFSDSDSDQAWYYGVTMDIDAEKYISDDDGVTWYDADTAADVFVIATATSDIYTLALPNTLPV